MSLKELTKEKHSEAERTPFMKAVFTKSMPTDVWANYTFNKMIWYASIEIKARDEGLLDNLKGLERTYRLYKDYMEMTMNMTDLSPRPITLAYQKYILSLDLGKVAAHLYVWHMGDLFGGQMIKGAIDVPHRNLDFDNADELKAGIRALLSDDLADEANVAFDWAIKIMHTYDNEFNI